jgi:hypothetical protein
MNRSPFQEQSRALFLTSGLTRRCCHVKNGLKQSLDLLLVSRRKEKEQQSIPQPGVSSLIDPLFAVSSRRQALMTPMALSACCEEGCGKAEHV